MDALDEYNAVVADGTKTDRERQQAGNDLVTAYLRQSEAAKKLAEDQAIANGASADSAEVAAAGTQAQIRELQGLASTLEPGSDLQNQIGSYIAALQSIPTEQETHVAVSSNVAEVVAGILHQLAGLQARVPQIRIPISSGRDLPGLVVANGNAAGGWAGEGLRGSTDTIPAWLSPGEFVLNARSAAALGSDTLAFLNATGFDTGGLVGRAFAQVGARHDAYNFVASTPAGRSLVVDDADATRSGVMRLADSYRELAATIGEADAAAILWRADTADAFDELATAAKDWLDQVSVMHKGRGRHRRPVPRGAPEPA